MKSFLKIVRNDSEIAGVGTSMIRTKQNQAFGLYIIKL